MDPEVVTVLAELRLTLTLIKSSLLSRQKTSLVPNSIGKISIGMTWFLVKSLALTPLVVISGIYA
jgi:hypothetical protein